MLSVRIDTFPVVVTTFGESFSEEDFAIYREVHEAILARDEAYVSLIDTSALVTVPSISVRNDVIEFARRNGDTLAHRCLATELVVQSIAVRTALSAVQWFSSTPRSVSLHASLRPAVSRSLDVVWTNQLTTSDTLLAYHDEVMNMQSMRPPRPSGSFTKRGLPSRIEGLLRRTRKPDAK